MRERLKRKQLPTWLGLLTVVAMFVCILVLHFMLSILGSILQVTFMEFVEYAIFILIGLLIVRKWLTEYEYAVIDDEFFVDRYIGKRGRRLFGIELSALGYIGSDLPESFSGKKIRLTYVSPRRGVVYMVYKDGANKKCAYFSPSDKLLEIIKKRASIKK